MVSKFGVRTDPAKLDAVNKIPAPTTITEVRSFLGLTSYYRKFVRSYSKIAKPLFDLTKKGHCWKWTTDCETAFQELKKRLTSAPILAYPQVNGAEFILDTDASNFAIGAVLSQVQDGKERVIAYGSRSLDKPERNYCVTQREMLAVVFFPRHFKHYLLGRRFTLRTDHGSLTWLQNFKEPDGQIHRWIQQLSQFHMKIVHRPGVRHGNADALSRIITSTSDICKQCKMPWDYEYQGPEEVEIIEMQEGDGIKLKNKVLEGQSIGGVTDKSPESPTMSSNNSGDMDGQLDCSIPGEIPIVRRGRKPNRPPPARRKPLPKIALDITSMRQQQEEDDIMGEILKLKIENAEKPSTTEISSKSKEFKFWISRWELLEVKNDVLCLYWVEKNNCAKWRVCAPKSAVSGILWYLHDARTSGHLGIKKTVERAHICPFYWWSMQRSAKEYAHNCEICEERKNPAHKKRHALKTHLVGAPFERIATDIAGPFPLSDNKNRYVLVVGDYFTKLTEAYPMPDMQAETVADIIFRAWVKRYGCPIELHSDQGRQYESTLFQNMCELLEIKKTRTTPLHPRSDGMIERMNRTIQDILSKYIKSHQRDWDQHLDFLTMAYNSTPHESTGLTPHRLVYGQEMKFPLDIISERIEQDEPQSEFASDYANKLEERLREAHEIAREHLKVSSERQKFQYDGNVKEKIYSDGQLVWRNQKQNIPGKKAKICKNWTGPWVIINKLSDVLYRIQHAKNSPPVVVHGDNLKPYRGSKKLKWFKQGVINENVTVSFPDLDNFLQSEDSEKDSENAEEFANDLPTELDESIIPNHQKEDKCIDNLPAVSKSPQKPEKEARRKSPEARKTEAQFPHLKLISISPDVAPAQENQNSREDKQYTTRKGRQIKVPEKFKDFIATTSSAKTFQI